MKAAFAGDIREIGVDAWPAAESRHERVAAPAVAAAPAFEEPASRYGEGRRLSLPSLLAIVFAHVALLWALVALDVVHITKKKAEPTIVDLIPDPIEPPPAPKQQPKPKVEVAQPKIVAPKPLVVAPAPAPPPVAVADTPPPPVPVAVAPPVVAAPAAEGPAIVEAVVAPSPLGNGSGNAAPEYPMEARRLRWSGTVRLRVVISTDGRVKEISVATSSGHDVLDKAALKAVSKWKFRPATRSGEAVEGVGYVPIPFVLKN